jgi:hypothetical protein
MAARAAAGTGLVPAAMTPVAGTGPPREPSRQAALASGPTELSRPGHTRARGLVLWSTVAMYAAYGSNMDPAQMAERCPHSPQRGSGWLEGWRLTFGGEELGWEGALATIVPDSGERVFVVLYDLSETDEAALDRWDAAATLDYYRKLRVRIATLEEETLAWLYVLNAYEGGLPSARYLGIMADAAEAAGAPGDYVTRLRARPCASLGD